MTSHRNRTQLKRRRRSGAGNGVRVLVRAVCLVLVGLSFVVGSPANAQTATVRGFATSVDDGEALQGVNVVLEDVRGGVRGIASNRDGFFLLSRIVPGRYIFRASFTGFITVVDTLNIEADDRIVVNVALESGSLEMGEIAVEAEREGGAGLQTIQGRDIQRIPAPDVSGDLVSYLSTEPGVVLMGDRGGQVFIRGGEPTQNMILLDGMDVFQPFHILGFYSAFPAEIVNHVDLYAGGFPGRYMGKISSVLDVRTRNGNKQSLGVSASLSPFTAAGHLEGPLVKGRISVLGAARVSMLDQIASHYVSEVLPYKFSDLFGKIHVVASENSQISMTALSTYDRGTLSSEDDFFGRRDVVRWRNTAIGGRYLFAPTTLSVLGELLVSYSRLESEFGPGEVPTRTSEVEVVNTALNMTYYAGRSEIGWGFFFRAPTTSAELDGLYQNLITRDFVTTHTGGYLDSEIYFGEGLGIRPSLSIQAFGVAGLSLEPRLRARWDRGAHHTSGAVGIYRQHFVGLSDRRDATSVFTAWVESPANEPSQAIHMLIGHSVDVAPGIEVSVEGFRKEMKNLFISEWTAFPSFTTRLQTVTGRVNGFELRVEVRRSRFYGFVTYGYSSTLYDVQTDNIARVDPGLFRPPHDRRHQVNLLMSANLRGFDVSVRWQLGSGLPYTRVEGFDGFILMDGDVDVTQVRGFPRVIYERIPYRSQLPAYHRLDISIERSIALTPRANVTILAGVLNAYDRANLFALDLLTTQRTDQLPIIPIVGMKLQL